MLLGCGSQVRAVGEEVTSSSRRVGALGEEGGMMVYVIWTFLAFRHMGSVEWVTLQVLWSHSRGGEVKAVDEGSCGLYFLGERRFIGGPMIVI